MRALGIDLGSKRIGVAISDSDGRLAMPYEVVQRSGDRRRDHRKLLELAAEGEVEAIVVGLPLSLDGSVGKAAKGVLAEVAELGATTDLPIETYDERLSTVTADRNLIEMNLKADARRKVVDKVAAAVILQAWLDRRAAPAPPSTDPDELPAPDRPDHEKHLPMTDSTVDPDLEDEQYWDDDDWEDDDYVFVPEDRGIGRKFAYVGLAFVLIIVLVLGLGTYWLVNQINPSDGGTGEPVVLVIPNDAGLATISRLLEEKGVVSNATIFRYYAKWKDIETVKAGEYDRLHTNDSMDDVITRLNQGPIPPHFSEVTFPEGLWLSETATTAITAYPEMDPLEFAQVLTSPDTPRSKFQPEDKPFDGFLFPATYRVEDPDRGNEQKLVDQMVKQFDTIGEEIGLGNAGTALAGQAGDLEITPYDAVIVASLIEGEASQPADRARVARVIYNRLERDMKLELDATVPFALGEKKEELTKSDLDVDSPYNTRKFPGLTPTPINSPGKDSLVAALNPSTEEGSDEWLFYVLIDKEGNHLFTGDYNEFLRAAEKARAEGVF